MEKYLGFFSGGKLRKVALAGGPVQVLCDAPEGRGRIVESARRHNLHS